MSTTVKMIRERLCAAERSHDIATLYGAVIALCDVLRPLGPNGKHGNRHTPLCGCEDVAPARPDVSGGYWVIGAAGSATNGHRAGDEVTVIPMGADDGAGKGSTAARTGARSDAQPAEAPGEGRSEIGPQKGVQSLGDVIRAEAAELRGMATGEPYVVGVRPQDLIGIAQELDDYAARADALEAERDRLAAWKRVASSALGQYDARVRAWHEVWLHPALDSARDDDGTAMEIVTRRLSDLAQAEQKVDRLAADLERTAEAADRAAVRLREVERERDEWKRRADTRFRAVLDGGA